MDRLLDLVYILSNTCPASRLIIRSLWTGNLDSSHIDLSNMTIVFKKAVQIDSIEPVGLLTRGPGDHKSKSIHTILNLLVNMTRRTTHIYGQHFPRMTTGCSAAMSRKKADDIMIELCDNIDAPARPK